MLGVTVLNLNLSGLKKSCRKDIHYHIFLHGLCLSACQTGVQKLTKSYLCLPVLKYTLCSGNSLQCLQSSSSPPPLLRLPKAAGLPTTPPCCENGAARPNALHITCARPTPGVLTQTEQQWQRRATKRWQRRRSWDTTPACGFVTTRRQETRRYTVVRPQATSRRVSHPPILLSSIILKRS